VVAFDPDPVGEELTMKTLRIWSPAFEDNGKIPVKYTCDGQDVNPPLRFENAPEGTKSLALLVEDPDAPNGLWVHWAVWNIAPQMHEIAENSVPRESMMGKNDFHRNSYGGPCPPSGIHRYIFRLFALDTVLRLPGSSTKDQLEAAMHQHILAQAQLTGLYGRS